MTNWKRKIRERTRMEIVPNDAESEEEKAEDSQMEEKQKKKVSQSS